MKIELLNGVVTLNTVGMSGVSVKVKPNESMRNDLIKTESLRNIDDLEFVKHYGEDILFRLPKRIEKSKTSDNDTIVEVFKRVTSLPDSRDDICTIKLYSDNRMNVIAMIYMIIDGDDYEFTINVSEEDIEVLKWVCSNYRLQ